MSCAPCLSSSADCTSFSYYKFTAFSRIFFSIITITISLISNPFLLAIVSFLLFFSSLERYDFTLHFLLKQFACRSLLQFSLSINRRKNYLLPISKLLIYCHLSKIVRFMHINLKRLSILFRRAINGTVMLPFC
ncbi:hypothetical protein CW304_29150 [Bacillus sp. UFRGS-B20]|nr:hypothetical protein CW304_29150 [Bacillus sp. UFRGS-B20]